MDCREAHEIDAQLLARMNDVQYHRGPDGSGVHLEPGVGFGHRRLSIIDLAGGAQPLYNEDGTVVVTFNGEIYNFKELVRELEAHGHRFRTRCDTEVIVHAWEQWGAECVRRFAGMFAFALWDRNRRTLFLARDRLGKKPLYYTLLSDGHLVFGSELKSLLVHPGVGRQLSPAAIEDYFAFGYIPDPKTIFTDVHKLPPASTLEVQRGMQFPAPRTYWDIDMRPRAQVEEQSEQRELVTRLREAVAIRLVADVPLGAFLSGGVDSSSIVAMMAELGSEPVRTCSISFGDPQFNESEYAQAVARRYHTDHHVKQVDPEDFSLLDRLANVYDEPFADSSAIPTFRVCEMARASVTVALSGDGGDENFAGYRRYRWFMNEQQVRDRIPDRLRGPLFSLLGQVYPKLDWAPRFLRAKATLQAIARDALDGYLHGVSIFPSELRAELFADGLQRDLQGYRALDVFQGWAARAPVEDALSLVQYLDFKTYLPGDILVKVDRASMANSLEVRVPLLDHSFVQWVAQLPAALKLRRGEGKYVFKRALAPYVSADILYRSKMGFAVPLASWIRGPLRQRVQDAVLNGRLIETGFFNLRALNRLVDQHLSGRRDHSPALWALLMFDGFLRRVGCA